MSLLHELPSRSGRYGRRECRVTRPWLEILERRDCPAVTASFSGGVLTVVGDEGNNVIQLFQPQDRVVQVTGDGQTWVFDGVDEVFVAAGDGDDQTTSSKPKEIVVVSSKIHIDVGAGNDTVRIDDGGPLEEEPDLLSTMNYSLNLGTGADALRVAAENSGMLNLSVQSADGFDRHELGHSLGFRHEHTRPESIIRLDLAGGGSLVDVDLDNIDDVDLSIISEPLPAEPAVSHTINVYFHVIRRDSGVARDEGVVILYSSLPGGDAIGRDDGLLQMITLSGSAGGADAATSVSAAIKTGATDDALSIQSVNVEDLRLDLDTGAGDDLVGWNFTNNDNDLASPSVETHGRGIDAWATIDLGKGDDSLTVTGADLNRLELDLTAGDGNDDVTAINRTGDRSFFVDETGVIQASADLGAGNDRLKLAAIDFDQALIEVLAGDGDDEVEIETQAGPYSLVLDPRGAGMVVDLGDGDNQLSVETSGFDEVTQDLRSGDGNDQIELADRAGPFFDFKATRLRQTIRTGGGNDIVFDDTEGRLTVETAIDTGAGDDGVRVHSAWAYQILPAATTQIELSLGAGNDLAALEILGYSQIAATIDTGPAGDGRDLIVGNFSLSPTDTLRKIRRALDGRQDLVELLVAVGYDVQIKADETTIYVLIGTPPSK